MSDVSTFIEKILEEDEKYVIAEHVSNYKKLQIGDNYSAFVRDNAQVLDIDGIRNLVNESEFEDEEGYNFETLMDIDSETTFYAATHNNIHFVGIKHCGDDMIFTKDGEYVDFSNLEKKSLYQEPLAWVLSEYQSVNSYSKVGKELSKTKVNENIDKIEAEYSHRYTYRKDGEIIAGIEVKNNVIENIHTKLGERQKGYAKELMTVAKKDFPELQHSESKTELGKKMASRFKM